MLRQSRKLFIAIASLGALTAAACESGPSIGAPRLNPRADFAQASPDLRHFAFVVEAGAGQQYVVVGGEAQKTYDRVRPRTLTWSPDSQRLAYVAQEGGQQFPVIDGDEGERGQGIERIVFSPDSQRWAYRVKQGAEAWVVSDGKKGRAYIEVSPPYLGEGNRLAYLAVRNNEEAFLVVEGEHAIAFPRPDLRIEQLVDGASLTFSPDARRFAYVSGELNDRYVVIDGLEGEHYLQPGNPVFSPDSRRIAYVALVTEGSFVVVDGHELGPYRGISSLVFSPDGERLSYVATIGRWDADTGLVVEESFAVTDGAEGEHYDRVCNLVSSPDSQQIAYIAERDGKAFAVIDGVEGPEHDVTRQSRCRDYQFTLSPDFRSSAYVANVSPGRYSAVVNGEVGSLYDEIIGLTLSPDGNRAAYWVKYVQDWFVVLDGQEGDRSYTRYPTPRGANVIVFDSNDAVHYLGERASEVFLVEQTLE